MMADQSEDQGARPLAGDSSGSPRPSAARRAAELEAPADEIRIYTNAPRMTACVRACEGIPNPEHLPELIEALALSEFDHGLDEPTRAAFAKMFDRKG